ncbi:MAG TPA: cytochrome P450 [Solirubrobacteraceae bacterium]|jgi:cytochrome P450|nr:cytochrome P450 [Solirubrobacteraceae bacterium]
MPPVDQLDLPTLDYLDPTLRGERFHVTMRELMADLRSVHGWLASGPYGYAVLDREAAEHFLRTRAAVFPGMTIADIFDVREGPLYEEMRRNILHINGPHHARLRSLLNPSLSPRAVERHRPAMRQLLQEIFARVDRAHCEFVEAIAKPYPSQAIAHVMGAPLEDAPRLHHWSNWIQRQFDAVSMMEQRPLIETAVAEFYEYAWELLRARRERPGEDLISQLIAATGLDDDGQQVERLSDVECVNLVLNVLIGGVDTTQSQLAHALRLFAEHPDQWALLGEQPELVPHAVEEALRFEPITPFTARILVEDHTFRDVTFPSGTILMVCAFTGNRDLPTDPAAEGDQGSGDPDRFDIRRDRGRARALTFGAGVHYCVGANLARLELQEALAFLAPRMPNLELAGEPVFEGITGIYGLAELPLRFGA